MKAIGFKQSLDIHHQDALIDFETQKPMAQGADILVKVEAVSVNPVDTKIRKNAAPENGDIKVLGWDCAGVVESVGEGVSLFKPGDKVWYAGAIDRSGSNAEYHLVDEKIVAKMPDSLSFSQAAALPLTSITAWEMLFDRFNVNAESTGSVLIIGGAGGVGSIMIQLAKKLTKLKVIATASRPETQQWVKELGADVVINHKNLLSEELEKHNCNGINFIASLTNTDEHFDEIVKIIAPQGKFGLIDDPSTLNCLPFKRKSVSVHWELMFTRSLFKTDDQIKQHQLLAKVADMVDSGQIKTTLNDDLITGNKKINAENLKAAHALLESGRSQGKIVLSGF